MSRDDHTPTVKKDTEREERQGLLGSAGSS
jgi:hypothetical protein